MMFSRVARIVLVACIGCSSCCFENAVGSKQKPRSASASPETLTPARRAEVQARVLAMWGDIGQLIGGGALEDARVVFRRYVALAGISQLLCGCVDDGLIEQICRYLHRLLNTAAVRAAQGYRLGPGLRVIGIAGGGIRVFGQLIGPNNERIPIVITLNLELATVELVVAGVPLFAGIHNILRQYFEAHGIRINEIRDPAERAAKCVAAIIDFIQNNPV